MADNFFSHKIVGKMKRAEGERVIHGAPVLHERNNGDSFYEKNSEKDSAVHTTGGIPGGKKPGGWFTLRKEHGDVADKGDKLSKHGHEYR